MDKVFLKKVGKNIRKYRKEAGLKQVELAVEINVSPSMIGMLEHARCDTTLSKINAISKALNVPVSNLLGF